MTEVGSEKVRCHKCVVTCMKNISMQFFSCDNRDNRYDLDTKKFVTTV